MALHMTTSGNGPDVVLLHGWGTGGAVWGPVARQLALQFTVHAVDLPGYGDSAPCAPYTLENLAQQVAACAPSATHVVGWSLGGQVAVHWAVARPAQVSRLALIATTPCFTLRADWDCAVAPAVFAGFAADLKRDRAGTLQRFMALQALGSEHAKAVIVGLRAALQAGAMPSPRALDAGLAILLDADLRAQAARVGQPTLVLHGARDTLAP